MQYNKYFTGKSNWFLYSKKKLNKTKKVLKNKMTHQLKINLLK